MYEEEHDPEHRAKHLPFVRREKTRIKQTVVREGEQTRHDE
jgi:hypothetical protein